VLLVHGSNDETVPVQNARSAARVLERGGISVTFTEVETGHTLDEALLEPVRRWLDVF
jgi:predicted esterase